MLNIAGKGKPIARFVKSDVYEKEILYLDETALHSDVALKKQYDEDDISHYLLKNKKIGSKRFKEIKIVKDALNKNVEPIEPEFKNIYNELKQKEKDNLGKEVKITSGFLQVIPETDPNKREIIFVAGASGSGKSYWTAGYANEYKKIYPDRNIIIFSKLDDDDILDKLKPLRIEINDELLTNPINMEELKNSLVIFDDTDTISDKLHLNAINQIKTDVLEIGRHFNISAVITSHLLTNYSKTRTILNELHKLVVYPASGSSHAINHVLTQYMGLDKLDVNKIRKLYSRWICVSRHYPSYIIYEKGSYLLNQN